MQRCRLPYPPTPVLHCHRLRIISRPHGAERVACVLLPSCVRLCDPMDCSPPGFSIHGVSLARILEWVAISSSRGSSRPRDQTHVSCIAGEFFTHRATWETLVLLFESLFRAGPRDCRWLGTLFPAFTFLPLGSETL